MVLSHRKSLCPRVASALVLTLTTTASLTVVRSTWAQPSADTKLSRYTTVSTAPDITQLDPLEAVVQVGLPRGRVATVGDAVHYLLLRTGYRLAVQPGPDAGVSAILAMPLPEVHRQLGPYSVRTALSVLLGSPFTLSVDPVQRLVSYRVVTPEAPGSGLPVAGLPNTEGADNGGTGSSR